jgi:hypothetical protein
MTFDKIQPSIIANQLVLTLQRQAHIAESGYLTPMAWSVQDVA